MWHFANLLMTIASHMRSASAWRHASAHFENEVHYIENLMPICPEAVHAIIRGNNIWSSFWLPLFRQHLLKPSMHAYENSRRSIIISREIYRRAAFFRLRRYFYATNAYRRDVYNLFLAWRRNTRNDAAAGLFIAYINISSPVISSAYWQRLSIVEGK